MSSFRDDRAKNDINADLSDDEALAQAIALSLAMEASSLSSIPQQQTVEDAQPAKRKQSAQYSRAVELRRQRYLASRNETSGDTPVTLITPTTPKPSTTSSDIVPSGSSSNLPSQLSKTAKPQSVTASSSLSQQALPPRTTTANPVTLSSISIPSSSSSSSTAKAATSATSATSATILSSTAQRRAQKYASHQLASKKTLETAVLPISPLSSEDTVACPGFLLNRLIPSISANSPYKCDPMYTVDNTKLFSPDSCFMSTSFQQLCLENVFHAVIFTCVATPSFFTEQFDWLRSCPRIDLITPQHEEELRPFLNQMFPHLHFHRPRMPSAYGVQHAKLILLRHPLGLRVIISTSNLEGIEATAKQQMLWFQDFPLRHASHFTHLYHSQQQQYDQIVMNDTQTVHDTCNEHISTLLPTLNNNAQNNNITLDNHDECSSDFYSSRLGPSSTLSSSLPQHESNPPSQTIRSFALSPLQLTLINKIAACFELSINVLTFLHYLFNTHATISNNNSFTIASFCQKCPSITLAASHLLQQLNATLTFLFQTLNMFQVTDFQRSLTLFLATAEDHCGGSSRIAFGSQFLDQYDFSAAWVALVPSLPIVDVAQSCAQLRVRHLLHALSPGNAQVECGVSHREINPFRSQSTPPPINASTSPQLDQTQRMLELSQSISTIKSHAPWFFQGTGRERTLLRPTDVPIFSQLLTLLAQHAINPQLVPLSCIHSYLDRLYTYHPTIQPIPHTVIFSASSLGVFRNNMWGILTQSLSSPLPIALRIYLSAPVPTIGKEKYILTAFKSAANPPSSDGLTANAVQPPFIPAMLLWPTKSQVMQSIIGVDAGIWLLLQSSNVSLETLGLFAHYRPTSLRHNTTPHQKAFTQRFEIFPMNHLPGVGVGAGIDSCSTPDEVTSSATLPSRSLSFGWFFPQLIASTWEDTVSQIFLVSLASALGMAPFTNTTITESCHLPQLLQRLETYSSQQHSQNDLAALIPALTSFRSCLHIAALYLQQHQSNHADLFRIPSTYQQENIPTSLLSLPSAASSTSPPLAISSSSSSQSSPASSSVLLFSSPSNCCEKIPRWWAQPSVLEPFEPFESIPQPLHQHIASITRNSSADNDQIDIHQFNNRLHVYQQPQQQQQQPQQQQQQHRFDSQPSSNRPHTTVSPTASLITYSNGQITTTNCSPNQFFPSELPPPKTASNATAPAPAPVPSSSSSSSKPSIQSSAPAPLTKQLMFELPWVWTGSQNLSQSAQGVLHHLTPAQFATCAHASWRGSQHPSASSPISGTKTEKTAVAEIIASLKAQEDCHKNLLQPKTTTSSTKHKNQSPPYSHQERLLAFDTLQWFQLCSFSRASTLRQRHYAATPFESSLHTLQTSLSSTPSASSASHKLSPLASFDPFDTSDLSPSSSPLSASSVSTYDALIEHFCAAQPLLFALFSTFGPHTARQRSKMQSIVSSTDIIPVSTRRSSKNPLPTNQHEINPNTLVSLVPKTASSSLKTGGTSLLSFATNSSRDDVVSPFPTAPFVSILHAIFACPEPLLQSSLLHAIGIGNAIVYEECLEYLPIVHPSVYTPYPFGMSRDEALSAMLLQTSTPHSFLSMNHFEIGIFIHPMIHRSILHAAQTNMIPSFLLDFNLAAYDIATMGGTVSVDKLLKTKNHSSSVRPDILQQHTTTISSNELLYQSFNTWFETSHLTQYIRAKLFPHSSQTKTHSRSYATSVASILSSFLPDVSPCQHLIEPISTTTTTPTNPHVRTLFQLIKYAATQLNITSIRSHFALSPLVGLGVGCDIQFCHDFVVTLTQPRFPSVWNHVVTPWVNHKTISQQPLRLQTADTTNDILPFHMLVQKDDIQSNQTTGGGSFIRLFLSLASHMMNSSNDISESKICQPVPYMDLLDRLHVNVLCPLPFSIDAQKYYTNPQLQALSEASTSTSSLASVWKQLDTQPWCQQ